MANSKAFTSTAAARWRHVDSHRAEDPWSPGRLLTVSAAEQAEAAEAAEDAVVAETARAARTLQSVDDVLDGTPEGFERAQRMIDAAIAALQTTSDRASFGQVASSLLARD